VRLKPSIESQLVVLVVVLPVVMFLGLFFLWRGL